MRLVTFVSPADRRPHIGALVDGDQAIVDLTAVNAERSEFGSMLEFIRAGERALEHAREAVMRRIGAIASGGVTLLAPLPNPPLMRDWGTMQEHAMFFVRRAARARVANNSDPEAAYQRLVEDGQVALPKNYFTRPRFYTCNPLNLIGHDAILPWPNFSRSLDYELELALVIGKTGRDIPESAARQHMFGITLFNDFTARDVQAEENSAAGKSKDFEGSYSLGPCIATIDEFRDVYDIAVSSRLNGQQQTQSSTSTMKVAFERLISYISQGCTLHAGEIFGTGTFENGCGVEKGCLLREGDVIELAAAGIGTLRNTIGPSSVAD